MREKRLIDIFQEQQEQKPFAFAYENLNAALQIFLANDRIAPKTVINVYPLANALDLSRTTVIKSLECLRKENWISLDEHNRYIAAKPTICRRGDGVPRPAEQNVPESIPHQCMAD